MGIFATGRALSPSAISNGDESTHLRAVQRKIIVENGDDDDGKSDNEDVNDY